MTGADGDAVQVGEALPGDEALMDVRAFVVVESSRDQKASRFDRALRRRGSRRAVNIPTSNQREEPSKHGPTVHGRCGGDQLLVQLLPLAVKVGVARASRAASAARTTSHVSTSSCARGMSRSR